MSELYLTLWHGRTSPEEELNSWGRQGPVFGPLDEIHQTYGGALTMFDLGGDFFGELRISNGLIYYDGIYYGDWNAKSLDDFSFTANPSLSARRREFNQELASPSATQPAAHLPPPTPSAESAHF